VRPRTSPESRSEQDSGRAYLAPPSPQPPVSSAPQTQSSGGAPPGGMSPHPMAPRRNHHGSHAG
jgi:hypothetical protein